MKNGWVEDHDGIKRHYVNDMLHNENGPAIIWADGTQEYWQNGERHREDGPAIFNPNGRQKYWLFGIEVTKEHFAILGLDDYPENGFTKDQVMIFSMCCMGD